MAFTLDDFVPWGRSFAEYAAMFALTEEDLAGRIVGCADGPAGFNAEATGRGAQVVSCDPIYRFSREELAVRIETARESVLEEAERNASEFVWTTIRSVEELGRVRMAAMDTFLRDFDAGKEQGRYVDATLPDLPFPRQAFDLALCSHFLFSYSRQLSLDFHVAAVTEMCRVAREARLFPLLALGSVPSPHVEPLRAELMAKGLDVSIEKVDYEFQKGGNRMMRVRLVAVD